VNEGKQCTKKDKNMKNAQIAKIFATVLAAFALAGAANAQYKAVGDDGIAASPKVRQALNAQAASANMATAKVSAMACAKCKDVTVTQTNPQAKGAEVLTGTDYKLVNKHTCGACNTRLDVVGTGKAKTTIATHTCAAPVANNSTCCETAMAK
jgi:hypothetical protein